MLRQLTKVLLAPTVIASTKFILEFPKVVAISHACLGPHRLAQCLVYETAQVMFAEYNSEHQNKISWV